MLIMLYNERAAETKCVSDRDEDKFGLIDVVAKPYFADHIGNMFVDPNQNVVWRCKAVARPTATYAWYKNGQLIQNDPGKEIVCD